MYCYFGALSTFLASRFVRDFWYNSERELKVVVITRAFNLNRTTVSAFNAPSVISTVSPGGSFSLTKVKCIGVPELVPCRSCGDESQQYLFSLNEISFACNLIWQAWI